jgi:hypothetical protein
MMALSLAAGPMAAQAQTYDLDILMVSPSGYILGTPGPLSITGSFTFNSHGTCMGSSTSCAAGTTPDFTNVRLSDPVGGGMFTVAANTGVAGELEFLDNSPPLNPPGQGPDYLLFNLNALLGGSQKTIGLSDVTYINAPNSSGIAGCGFVFTPNVTCPTAALTEAPEIDPASTGSGLALLLGTLIVLRGRRAAD